MHSLDDLDLGPLRDLASPAVVGVVSRGVRRVVPVGRAERSARFRIASLTKPITAVAALKAADEAGVTLDTPVLDVLPQLRADWVADRDLTIAQVLAQTSGLEASVTARDIAELGDDDSVGVEAARLVVRGGNARPPGGSWEYYNGNYVIAGAVIAALTGQTYEDAAHTLVLDPWRLATTSFATPPDLVPGSDEDGQVAHAEYPRGRRPSGGLCSTVDDLLTFGQRLLVDVPLLDRVRTVSTRVEDPVRYGLGWAIGSSGQMYLNGRLPGYRAALLLHPGPGLVAAVLTADTRGLPAAARILSDLQLDATGDDLARAIDAFAA